MCEQRWHAAVRQIRADHEARTNICTACKHPAHLGFCTVEVRPEIEMVCGCTRRA